MPATVATAIGRKISSNERSQPPRQAVGPAAAAVAGDLPHQRGRQTGIEHLQPGLHDGEEADQPVGLGAQVPQVEGQHHNSHQQRVGLPEVAQAGVAHHGKHAGVRHRERPQQLCFNSTPAAGARNASSAVDSGRYSETAVARAPVASRTSVRMIRSCTPRRQARVDRQAQHAVAQGTGARLRGLRLEVVEGVQRRVEIAPRVDVLAVERGAHAQQLGLVAQRQREVAVVALAARLRPLQVEVLAERALVAMGDLGALLEDRVQVVEDAQPHGGADLVELGIDAGPVDLVGVDDAEVAEQANPRGQFVVVGDDGAALDGVEQLGGVKAQRADVAPVEHRLAWCRTPKAWAPS